MAYLTSLLVGVGVGVVYALLDVRSPAPPLVALVGLLGIVVGEQGVPLVKAWVANRPVTPVSVLPVPSAEQPGPVPAIRGEHIQ